MVEGEGREVVDVLAEWGSGSVLESESLPEPEPEPEPARSLPELEPEAELGLEVAEESSRF